MARPLVHYSKKKTGRPTKMTQGVINKLEYAFALGCTDLEACFYADIKPETLYNYQATYPDFVQRKEMLKQKPVLQARESLIKGIQTDPELALKYLERKLKKEFSTRQEITGEDGSTLTFILQELSKIDDVN